MSYRIWIGAGRGRGTSHWVQRGVTLVVDVEACARRYTVAVCGACIDVVTREVLETEVSSDLNGSVVTDEDGSVVDRSCCVDGGVVKSAVGQEVVGCLERRRLIGIVGWLRGTCRVHVNGAGGGG